MQQFSLFPDQPQLPEHGSEPLPPGLRYCPEFIAAEEEAALLHLIDNETWLDDLKRRVQHYGFRYNYKQRSVSPDDRIGPLPPAFQALGRRIHQAGYIDAEPDQAIVNAYEPGQGIAPHVDCEPCFTDSICSLSLLSPIEMAFTPLAAPREGLTQLLAPRSLIVLAGKARYEWTHGIRARKSDPGPFGKGRVPRRRRISITFRNVVLDA